MSWSLIFHCACLCSADLWWAQSRHSNYIQLRFFFVPLIWDVNICGTRRRDNWRVVFVLLIWDVNICGPRATYNWRGFCFVVQIWDVNFCGNRSRDNIEGVLNKVRGGLVFTFVVWDVLVSFSTCSNVHIWNGWFGIVIEHNFVCDHWWNERQWCHF